MGCLWPTRRIGLSWLSIISHPTRTEFPPPSPQPQLSGKYKYSWQKLSKKMRKGITCKLHVLLKYFTKNLFYNIKLLLQHQEEDTN